MTHLLLARLEAGGNTSTRTDCQVGHIEEMVAIFDREHEHQACSRSDGES